MHVTLPASSGPFSSLDDAGWMPDLHCPASTWINPQERLEHLMVLIKPILLKHPEFYLYPKHHWAGPKIPLAISILIPNVCTMENVKHDVKKGLGFFFKCKKMEKNSFLLSYPSSVLKTWSCRVPGSTSDCQELHNEMEKKPINFSLTLKPLIIHSWTFPLEKNGPGKAPDMSLGAAELAWKCYSVQVSLCVWKWELCPITEDAGQNL